jgi:hypothetical protein
VRDRLAQRFVLPEDRVLHVEHEVLGAEIRLGVEHELALVLRLQVKAVMVLECQLAEVVAVDRDPVELPAHELEHAWRRLLHQRELDLV